MLGTFTLTEVRSGLESGRFLPTDLAWREGMEAWVLLGDFPLAEEPLEAATPPPILADDIPLAPTPESETIPWEKRDTLGFLPAMVETVKLILSAPKEAFKQISPGSDLIGPLIFCLIISFFSGFANALYNIAFMLMGPSQESSPSVSMEQQMLIMAAMVILSPLLIAVFTFLYAGIYHLLLMLTGGANRGFNATFRVYAYALGAISVIGFIPFCGVYISIPWLLILLVIGFVEVHKASSWQAIVAVLLPIILCCGLVFAVVVAAFGSFAYLLEAMGSVK